MSENAMSNTSRTNWAKVDALTDEEIDTSQAPAMSEEFFAKATWRMPRSSAPVAITVRVDPEVLAWFQAQGADYEQRMQAALRIYAEAHRAAV
jgi:uncharacterized protein (DUF4415 family)